jgi:hypothetical protein
MSVRGWLDKLMPSTIFHAKLLLTILVLCGIILINCIAIWKEVDGTITGTCVGAMAFILGYWFRRMRERQK